MDIQKELKSPIIYDGSTRVYAMRLLEGDYTFGLRTTFKEYYKKYYTGEYGVINVGAAVVQTTPEVMAALKAVLSAGCCRMEGRAAACRIVFLRACTASPLLDKDVLFSTFVEEADNPFVLILQDIIRRTLNGE